MSCLRMQASYHYFRLGGLKQKIPAFAGMTDSAIFLNRADKKNVMPANAGISSLL
jgi:hypothetical protein